MFGQADFDYTLDEERKTISIIDNDMGGRSVTNDIENVLGTISRSSGKSLAGYKAMYRDSMGIWDGITIGADGRFTGFFSINEKDSDNALSKLVDKTIN